MNTVSNTSDLSEMPFLTFSMYSFVLDYSNIKEFYRHENALVTGTNACLV
jgi:hypothetical protein